MAVAPEEVEVLAPGSAPEHPYLPVRVEYDDPDDLEDDRISDVNEWGRSEHMRELARRLYDPVYRNWFRVEWEGLEKIPTDGGALLVANHAGRHPVGRPGDHARHRDRARPPRATAWPTTSSARCRSSAPCGTDSVACRRTPTTPTGCCTTRNSWCWCSPRAPRARRKTFDERYQLRRFGRGGFVEIAMRAGVPVVPIAVVGAEESMPTLVRIPSLARALGLPYVPITANMLVAGPLGAVAYFPAKFKLKVLDPVHFDVPPDQERYSRSRIMDESEAIRDRIQAALYEMLRSRRSVWFG